MKGTIPNHEKKHKKKAIEVIQNVLVEILLKLSNCSFVAFLESIFSITIYLYLVMNFKTTYLYLIINYFTMKYEKITKMRKSRCTKTENLKKTIKKHRSYM